MPLGDDLEQRISADLQDQLYLQAQRNALNDVSPAAARRDSRLRRNTGIPLQSFDDTTRSVAEARERAGQAQQAIRRAPRLAPVLADPHRYPHVADDLDSLSRMAHDLGRMTMLMAPGGRPAPATRPSYLQNVFTVLGRLPIGSFIGPALSHAGGSATADIEERGLAETARAVGRDLRSRNLGRSFVAGGARLMEQLHGVNEMLAPIVHPFSPMVSIEQQASREAGDYWHRIVESYRSPTETRFGRDVLSGVESAPTSVIAYGGGAVTGSAKLAAAALGLLTAGGSYREGRAANLSPLQATVFGLIDGTIEAGTELIPLKGFLGDLAAGRGAATTIMRNVLAEGGTEQFATLGQDFNRWAQIDGPNGKPFTEFLSEIPDHAVSTFVSSAVVASAQTSAGLAVDRITNRGGQADGARAWGRLADRIMEAAGSSRLRQESPEDFRELLAEQMEGKPGELLYIPAEIVRTLHQSPEDLADDPFWGDYAGQIAEAEALGGDVVVPLADVATHLAGHPQWEAIKDHVRASAGGMSRTEAEEWDADFGDAMRQTGEQLAAEQEAERAAMEPVQKIHEAMRDKLMLAGFRPDAANNLATLFAQRQRVRAERLGRELTGEEAGAVEVRQVLPENLARIIRAAEVPDAGLREVIAEMRRGRGTRSDKARFGPSLLDWIAAQGGIDDTGGDVAAMGAGKAGKGFAKKGQRKLIRRTRDQIEAEAAQGSMIGAGRFDNRPDDLALRAWEAGYFPEFSERPEVNDLLEAIAEGLSGRDRFANVEETDDDRLRMAAQELTAILDQQGVDPEKATPAEIAKAVSQYQSARESGRSLDQPAFHGSPHIFDRFSTEFMGTGEGAQAFGWGLYFAGKKEVAAYYREALSRSQAAIKVDGERFDEGGRKDHGERTALERAVVQVASALHAGQTLDDALRQAKNAVRSAEIGDLTEFQREGGWGDLEKLREVQRIIEEWRSKDVQLSQGRLYEVEIPEDDEYLDWELPFREQPAKAQAALRMFGFGEQKPPPPIKDPRVAAIVRGALKQSEGDPANVMLVIDNDYALYQKALALAEKAGIDTDQTSPGEYVVQQAWDHLEALEAQFQGDTGESMYRSLARQLADEGEVENDKAASLALLKAGVPGIRFPSGTLSAVEDGTYNYVIFDDSRVAIRSFEQSDMGGPRGRITFADSSRFVIELFESRDLSTFIHESGHLFLEELKADAELALQMDTPAARQLFADWEAVKAWFKREGHEIGEDGQIPTEAHELWARSWERFAMEGKAPSSALRRAFEAFRSWLLTIYKVVDNLRAPITPEIRDVMGRMLATEEEIAAAAEEQEIRALFKTAEEAGMTEAEFKAYRQATETARDEAYDALLYRTMATVRAARTKEWKEREVRVRAEATEEVDRQPVFRALRLLRTGKTSDMDEEARRVRLDRQWLIDTYGADALNAMPRMVPPVYADKDTTHPDDVAEELGFATGDEMVRTLMGHETARQELRQAGDKRSPRQVQIDEAVAARMAERYGDPLRDGSIEEEARALIHNDQQGEVIASELRALARRSNRRSTPYSIAKRWAAEKVAAGKVVDMTSGASLQQWERAARRAGKAAEDAMLKGDVDETYRQKQSQMLNNALIAEGKKARDRVDVAVRRLGRIARKRTMPSVSQDYLDQAHQLLENVQFQTRSQRDIDKQQSFEAWHAAEVEAGHDPIVPDSFALSLGTTHWSRLNVEELIGLDDTVQQIMHLGRLKQTLLDGQERRAFEEVIAEMQATGGGLKQRPPVALNDPDRSRLEWTKSKLRGADAAMVKIEQLVDWLDGGNPNGVFNRIIFRPLAEAQGREADLMRDYIGRLQAAVEAMPRAQLRDWRRLVDTPELINRVEGHPLRGEPWAFYKDQIVAIALNWGNEGNRQRLLDGYGWSESQVRSVLDRLMTAEDWAFVQTVWDTIDGLWPEIAALEQRVNGFAPDKVEAVPVETPHGTFRGGYYPAVYDPQWSSRSEHQAETNLLERGYTRANVRASSTKERAAQVKRPILLSMEVITRHVGEVIHDITHREALTEVWKAVSDQRVQRTVTNVMGPEYAKLFRPWLKHIANDQARNANSNDVVIGLARRLRHNVTIVGLGYRLTTVVAQLAGMPNIIAQIGNRRMAEGWGRFLANPMAAYREVTTKSAEMRDRFSTMDRDIVERAQTMSKRKGIRAITAPMWFTRFAFHGILVMDSILTTSGWIGAYRKATADGMSEDEAIFFADKAIRKSQGAGGAKDQAAIQREHEWFKLFTMFFSYFSALYNQQRDFGHRLRRVSGAKDTASALNFGFWVMVMPPIMTALILGELPGGGDDDEDETAAEWAAKKIFFGNASSLPLIRDVVGTLDRGFGYRMTPAQNVGESVLQAMKNAQRRFDGDPGTEPSDRWLKQTLTLFGLTFGKPTGQLSATSQFALDVAEGRQEPDSLSDFYWGATTGQVPAAP